jgi:hypothetical protein
MAALAYKFTQDIEETQVFVDMHACDELRLHVVGLACAPVVLDCDVEHLWSLTFNHEVITRDVIEALFVIEAGVPIKCPSWAAFLTETVAHFAIWEMRPTGVISGSMAEWLVGLVDRAGTPLALGVLAHIIAEAPHVPVWLPAVVRARLARFEGVKRVAEEA